MIKHRKHKIMEQEPFSETEPAGEMEAAESQMELGDQEGTGISEAEVPVAFDSLQNELNETKTKADEYLDGWQRTLAEFANYKKRIDREQEQAYQNTVGNVVKHYLPVVDDLERALNSRSANNDDAAWLAGIELIYRKIITTLETDGIKVMETEGQLFDPNLHEAIATVPSDDHESGQIIDVLQKGYLLGDRVLRPALVRVAE
jgi:molecular chaperone GrpE